MVEPGRGESSLRFSFTLNALTSYPALALAISRRPSGWAKAGKADSVAVFGLPGTSTWARYNIAPAKNDVSLTL